MHGPAARLMSIQSVRPKTSGKNDAILASSNMMQCYLEKILLNGSVKW